MTEAQRAVIEHYAVLLRIRAVYLRLACAFRDIGNVYAADCERQRRADERQRRYRYGR